MTKGTKSRTLFRNLTLAQQFILAGFLVLVSGMLIIGFIVTSEIEEGVTRNTAASTALYMESFVAPRVQELANANTLSPAARRELDKILKDSELGKSIVSFKIWKEGGLIAYSSRPSIIGKTFPVTPNLRAAWKGEVTAEFDTLVDEEDALERARNMPLLEMYSPIRQAETGRIIAVAEFYETASQLRENLYFAGLQSWAVVAAVGFVMFAALSGIVTRGSRTIDRQRNLLQRRVNELSKLLSQNEGLRRRLENSSRRVTEVNEQYLRRIGADLHDGPAQLIGFSLLRLDSLRALLRRGTDSADGLAEADAIHDALREAMDEIRQLNAGLTLAKLEEMSLPEVLREITVAHERRTKTSVDLRIDDLPDQIGLPFKILIFRFVQEGLNNAFRHAGGKGQKVTCRVSGDCLEVTVSDEGPGFSVSGDAVESQRLGLYGLRERIESLGGTMRIESREGAGSELRMRCVMGGEE
jgi:signal transduction histidine kinase